MTVEELETLLAELPKDMAVMLDMPNGAMISACFANSKVEEIILLDDEDDSDDDETIENAETVSVFLLKPCGCSDGTEHGGVINSQPDLN